MGCCSSHEADIDIADQDERVGNVPRGGNKPLKRKARWTANPPITESQLRRQVEEFWETAPTYEGRAEIWQAIRATLEAEDDKLGQSILDAAGVTLPTGNPADGCYDELGNRYLVPNYCISPPTNLIPDPAPVASSTSFELTYPPPPMDDSEIHSLPPEEKPSGPSSTATRSHISAAPLSNLSHPIIIRLSTAVDLTMMVPNSVSAAYTVATLKEQIYDAPTLELTREKQSIRLLYFGRVLEDTWTISGIEGNPHDVGVRGKIENGAVFVPKDGVVQVLITERN